MSAPFHLAFFITDIEKARDFYKGVLGCEEGRSTEDWIDFELYGNQLSMHLDETIIEPRVCGKVDGITVPIPHFGVIISNDQFDQMAKRLESSGINFIVKPQTRYEGKKGEQKTMFFKDPFGKPIEIKSFSDNDEIFEKGSECLY